MVQQLQCFLPEQFTLPNAILYNVIEYFLIKLIAFLDLKKYTFDYFKEKIYIEICNKFIDF